MNIVLLDGSPKYKDSASNYLLKALESRLGECDITWCDVRKYNPEKLSDTILKSDALVLAFPLYVDSIPSHLLLALTKLQPLLQASSCQTKMYTIVNCGFYDAVQNHIALDMIHTWCDKSRLRWGQGIAVGGGGMIQAAPIGSGPCTSIGKSFDCFAENILSTKSTDTLFTEPDFPRFLYKAAAHMGWRLAAKKNGLKAKELKRQHIWSESAKKADYKSPPLS